MADTLKYDDEWSRLIHAIGREALMKMQGSNILLSGLKGLGLEVAKNVVLMGIKRLTIHDPAAVAIADLSSQFYLTEADVGKNRAEASLLKLRELNPRVEITVQQGALTDDVIAKHTLTVLTAAGSKERLLHVAAVCRKAGVAFIAADTFGLLGWVFNDFGPSHTVTDRSGETPLTGHIWTISEEEQAIVTCLEGKRHDLQDGDYVSFRGVKGMTGINGQTFRVTVKDPYAFQIGDTRALGVYTGGGEWEQVSMPFKVEMAPLSSFWHSQPPFDKVQLMDFAKFERPPQEWVAIQALYEFQDEHSGRLPRPWNADDAAVVVAMAHRINDVSAPGKLAASASGDAAADTTGVDDKLIGRLAMQAAGDLAPMAAFLGGIIAQEAIKAASSKFTPLNQFFIHDQLECLPDAEPTDAEPTGSRYDGQVAVFGRAMQQKLLDARYFLIGAGAIGCEMLKNWAMMGVGCGPNGHIHVTDNDNIEVSNLNRQFLYREWDVKKMKSATAAAAVQRFNPAMNITAYSLKACPETENHFGTAFWNQLTGVCNALDNVNARLYIDSRCVFFHKSLLESGTLGPKGNTQVIVPEMTESYGSSADPPEKQAPVCLVHSFPYNIDHCLQWAREVVFEGRFVADPDIAAKWLADANYLDKVAPNLKRSTLETLKSLLIDGEKTIDECARWARLLFEKVFASDLKQLLHQFPADFLDPKTGAPFWSGTKRPPTPAVFSVTNPTHLDFVVAATVLRAYTLGILASELRDGFDYAAVRAQVAAVAAAVEVPAWKPLGALKIVTDENETAPSAADAAAAAAGSGPGADDDDAVIAAITAALPARSAVTVRPRPIEFEKDDDRNFHIDAIHAAASVRAESYEIVPVDRLTSKLKAGRIVPAIVTTTASVTGLVCLELYKLLLGKNKIEDFRNSFMNLALPVFQQAEPTAPKKEKWGRGREFTLWTHLDIRKGDLKLSELLELLSTEYGIETDVLGVGSALIYSSWMPPAKQKQRKETNMKALYEEVSKAPITAGQSYLSVVVTGTVDDEDVELPPITIWL